MIGSADEFVRLRCSSRRAEYFLAAHDEAPLAVWLEVITRFPEMKKWVAHNKTVPLEILEILAAEEDAEVRWSVAIKRKLSPELLERLSSDQDETVRHRVALNAKTPTIVVMRLATDQSPLVRAAALKRLAEVND